MAIKFTDLAKFQPKQKEAWFTLMNPLCKYLLYGGAAYGGKSYFLRWAAIGLGMYYYGKYGFKNIPIGLFSEDYPTLKDRQVVKMKHEIPEELGRLIESRDEGYAFIGAKEYGEFMILLRNLDDPSKYSSVEFAAELVEETTKNPHSTFDDLRFRLRYPGISDVKFVGATNPGGIGHGFVKQLWVKPDPSKLDIEQNRFFFVPALYSDNKFTTDDYIKQLDSLPDDKRKAYKDGSWDVFAGQYYSEWNDRVHVVPSFIPSKEKVIVGGLDWGRKDNFAFYLSEVSRVNYDGGHFNRSRVFLEVYGKGKNPTEWDAIIQAKLKNYKLTLDDVAWVRADTQIWSPGDDARALDIFTQFVNADPRWRSILKQANKDRIGGWENLHNWLSIAPDNRPYLEFSNSCPNIIRTLPELVYDEKGTKVEDIAGGGEDDAPDSVRYLHFAVKWIDAKLGAMIHREPTKLRTTAEFVNVDGDQKQVGVDLKKFETPNILQRGKRVGAILRN